MRSKRSNVPQKPYCIAAHKTTAIVIAFLLAPAATRADLDPCPTKQRDFRTSASIVRSAWQKQNTQLNQVMFDKSQFDTLLRAQLETQALKDIQDTIASLNSTRP